MSQYALFFVSVILAFGFWLLVDKRQFGWMLMGILTIWTLNIGLNNVTLELQRQAVAVERQALAAEQSVKLLKEQNESIPELQKLMDQLRSFPLPAEPASSPKK